MAAAASAVAMAESSRTTRRASDRKAPSAPGRAQGRATAILPNAATRNQIMQRVVPTNRPDATGDYTVDGRLHGRKLATPLPARNRTFVVGFVPAQRPDIP